MKLKVGNILLELELNNLNKRTDCISFEDIVDSSFDLNSNITTNILGFSLQLNLNSFQATRVNQFLGCIRKLKNTKIDEIHKHNKNYLKIDLYNQFKLENPTVDAKNNPYKYVYPDQSYARSKNVSIDFIGPLTDEEYHNVYKNNKHYMERTPSVLYRNSLKDLLQANNKYIADVFNKSITYVNKRKPLRFIKKNRNVESFLITDSDNMFSIKDNKICFGSNFDKSYQVEQEIKLLSKQLKDKNSNLSVKEKTKLTKQLQSLQLKLDKDYSYLGVLKFVLPKQNKSSKEIDFNSIKSIRIKKDGNKYSVSFSFEYINSYIPSLLRLDNNEEITTKAELAYYIEELFKQDPQLAIKYLEKRVLGIDRGIVERLALSNDINNANNKNNFLSYSEEIKFKIEKLKKQIKYHKRQLARRTKDSRGYKKSLSRHKKLNSKLANIRKNTNHQVSHVIVEDYDYPIIALEKLNLKGMTKRSMPKINIAKSLSDKYNVNLGLTEFKLNEIVTSLEEYYKENKLNLKYKDIIGEYKLSFSKNKASTKSGLNESMLNQNHGQFGEYLEYKSTMHGKVVIEVPAHYSSQECNECGYVEKGNRVKTKFCCKKCGHEEHADSNASKVISGRVYKELIKYATELRKKAELKERKAVII